MEVILKACLVTTADLSCALNFNETISFTNDLIKGKRIAAKIIAWKKKHNIYNPDADLLGQKWYKLFKK